MNELLHADPIVLSAIAAVIMSIGYTIKKLGDARAFAIVAAAEAGKTIAAAEAKAKTADEENTGRFLTLATKDRDQIDSLMQDVRRELVRCESERKDIADRMDSMQKVIDTQEQRIAELEAANHALFKELQSLHDSIGTAP